MRQRREFDKCLIGRNLKRMRVENNLTVEDVRDYLCMGSTQAIYKYEEGTNYPSADTLLALMELYGADFQDLICEQLIHCRFLQPGSWLVSAARKDKTDFLMDIVAKRGSRYTSLPSH